MLVVPASYSAQRFASSRDGMRLSRPRLLRALSAFARFYSRIGSETIGFWLKLLYILGYFISPASAARLRSSQRAIVPSGLALSVSAFDEKF
jgi:hypothetical protein